jgi:hypothetical protein
MPPVLVTPHLILRPLELADAAQAQPLFCQWEVLRLLAAVVPWPYPADGAYTFTATLPFQPWRAGTSGTGPCASKPTRTA